MTWENIKAQLIILYSKYAGTNGFIETESGNPTDLAMLVDLVHQQINSNPGNPDYFKRKVGQTVTLTGATSYDLRTLFPDYMGIYQVYGINDYEEQVNVSQGTNNLLRHNESYSVTNGVLYLAEGYPSTGTLKIDYKSAYMVEDSSGNRKQFFTDVTDVSVLLPNHIWVLLLGVGQYVNWKADNASKAQRDFVHTQFAIAEQSLFLHQEQENSIGNFLN